MNEECRKRAKVYRCCFASFDSREAADAAAEVVGLLKDGGVGVLPTETVPGIVRMWDGPEAISHLQRAKGRDANQKCQLLIGSMEHADAFGIVNMAELKRVGDAFWPGPLTAIANTADDTVGLRMPDLAWLRQIIEQLGSPLVASSANPPGVDPAASAANGYSDLPGPLAFVVSGPQGGGSPSTVARLAPFEILRPGPIDATRLASVVCGEGAAL